MLIKCTKNGGYKWYNKDTSYFRGYIQLKDGKVFRGDNAIQYLKSVDSFDGFIELLRNIFGVFSIIITKENEVWTAVDIARSMPIYYANDASMISDDVGTIKEAKKIRNSEANPLRLLEIYECTYTAYNSTVFDCISQLSAGTCARFIGENIEVKHYYRHISIIKPIDMPSAIEKLNRFTDRMIQRMKIVVGDRTIALSLSGGHDSRYLACSLKKNGINNVICFSYGKKGSDEVRMSEMISKALGYEWHNIEYTDEKIQSLMELETERFRHFSENYDSTSYMQNFLAVRELTQKHLIPDNSVFITGLCNDMPTGQYVPSKGELSKYSMDIDGAIDYLFNTRFFKFPANKQVEKQIKKQIFQSLMEKEIEVIDYQTFIQATDSEITDYDHTRWFSNMNKAHNFFGYEWLMPCWDMELLDFWYQIPVELRFKQRLYNEYIKDHLTNVYGIPFEIVAASYGSNNTLVAIKRKIGGFIVKCSYPLGIPLRRNADINNFAMLEIALYRRIKNKKMIDMKYAGMMYLLTVFELEEKYGADWYEHVKPLLE